MFCHSEERGTYMSLGLETKKMLPDVSMTKGGILEIF
jgi:hypothetical protein